MIRDLLNQICHLTKTLDGQWDVSKIKTFQQRVKEGVERFEFCGHCIGLCKQAKQCYTDSMYLHAAQFLRAYFEMLYDFFSSKKSSPLSLWGEKEVLDLLDRLSVGDIFSFVARVKFFLAYPLALFLRREHQSEDLPVPPDEFCRENPWMFKGALKRSLVSRTLNRKNSKLFFDIAYGVKKGCKTLPRAFLGKVLLDHSRTLGTPPDALMGIMGPVRPLVTKDPSHLSYWDVFSTECDRFLDMLCKGMVLDYSPMVPSFSGCSQYSRRQNGSYGKLVEGFKRCEKCLCDFSSSRTRCKECSTWVSCSLSSSLVELISMKPYDKYDFDIFDAEGDSWETLRYVDPYPVLCDREKCVESVKGHPSLLTEDWNTDAPSFPSDEFRWMQETWVPFAKVKPVFEPLKVRTITAGPATVYHRGRVLQKALWSRLSGLEPFALIGAPVVTSDLIAKLVERSKVCYGEFSKVYWNSGDYSAATDGLDIRVQRYILNGILNRLSVPESWGVYFRHCLDSHLLEYSEDDFGENRSILQRNGQLMGSVLSFPILCIANYLVYRVMLRLTFGANLYELCKEPVLINGDDCLFPVTLTQSEVWRQVALAFGFKKSVGKNYLSSDHLVINSQMFTIRGAMVREVPCLNLGFLTGRTKLGRELGDLREEDYFDPLLAHETVMKTCSNPKQTMMRFHFYWGDILKEISSGKFGHGGKYNYFLPRWLGGLGLTLPPGWKVTFTDFQRDLASALYAQLRYDFHPESMIQKVKFVVESPLLVSAPIPLYTDLVTPFLIRKGVIRESDHGQVPGLSHFLILASSCELSEYSGWVSRVRNVVEQRKLKLKFPEPDKILVKGVTLSDRSLNFLMKYELRYKKLEGPITWKRCEIEQLLDGLGHDLVSYVHESGNLLNASTLALPDEIVYAQEFYSGAVDAVIGDQPFFLEEVGADEESSDSSGDHAWSQ